jgi:hypothetical protein
MYSIGAGLEDENERTRYAKRAGGPFTLSAEGHFLTCPIIFDGRIIQIGIDRRCGLSSLGRRVE